jgi:hypothetical protein
VDGHPYKLFASYNTATQQRILGVEVHGALACPCAMAMTGGLSHNQRGRLRIELQTNGYHIPAEELVAIAESAFSTPVRLLLKRPQEKAIVEAMHRNPKFVEDVVRDCVIALRERYRGVWARVRCDSFESTREMSRMGWLKNFFKRIVVEAITEVLEPHIRVVVREEFENLEPRIRAIVQEEFIRLEPRIRAIVREEFENLEPRIRAIVRDEMRVAFEQEWEPRIRAIVREELRTAMEEEWVPRLQATWREDINRMQDRFNTRFDSVQGRLDNLAEMMLHATVQVREMSELTEVVRSLRSEVERIKAHIGLT